MTPQEKSKQLYNKFLRYVPAEEEFEHEYAKQCAFIAVDEILVVMNEEYFSDALKIEYWEQV